MKRPTSDIFAVLAAITLIASPWVDASAQWTVYGIGVACCVCAAIFRLSND